MLVGVLITSQNTFRNLPSREWVEQLLAAEPLEPVLHLFTHVLHTMELSSNPTRKAMELLPTIAEEETVRAVRKEVTNYWSNGVPATVFYPLLLIAILKEAILKCKGAARNLSLADMDQLVRAYLATHDHYQDALIAPGRSLEERTKEEVLRQALTGLGDEPALTLPRYWALWVTIPKQLGLLDQLASFLPPELPRPISACILPLLALWAFFGHLARTNDSRPLIISREGWNAEVLAKIESLTTEITLGLDEYAQKLAEEKSGLGAGERWEYSIKTTSRYPLLRIDDRYFCISLALLANTFGDGLYHRMFQTTAKDNTKVNELTSIFGQLFERYVRDLWERIAGASQFHKLTAGRGAEELGDGIIAVGDGIIIYDAKSRRPPLSVVRSGDQDAFFADLERNVISAARQLDGAIKKLRSGTIDNPPEGLAFDRIFPVIVTARHFPEVPFVYERIDKILAAQNLLQDAGIAPLLVIDVETLEIMEGLRDGGSDAVALLLEKARTPKRRAQSLDDRIFSEGGELPWPSRLRETFREAGECGLAWAKSGQIDEERVDRILYPG